MSTTFPASKQSFTEPPSPTVTSMADATYPHTAHHVNLGDTLEAVQDSLGYSASGDGAGVDSYVSGLWNASEGPTGGHLLTQDVLCLRRFRWRAGVTFVQLGCWVQTANTATSVFRFGLYEDNGSGTYPGALILDAGVSTADLSTTGFKSCTAFSATDVGGRFIWMGGAVQVAAPVSNGLNGVNSVGRGMAISTVPNLNPSVAYSQSGVTGALPGTFTATRAWSNAWAKIWYK